MAKTKKKNKIRRYLAVNRRRVKRLNRKKIGNWLKVNLKQHPFILAILFFIWIKAVLVEKILTKGNIIKLLRFNLLILISWLILVILSNPLKDKYPVKWYLKKRFVFLMLLLFPPLGLVFLWSGSRFKKITKIIFSVVFSSLFIVTQVYYNKKYEKFINKSSLERIVEIITKPKQKIYLKTLSDDVFKNFGLSRVQKKAKVKLAVSEIASRCSSGVVSIKTKDKEGKEIGDGAGFVISKNGIIATNFHVLESAYQAEVKIGEDVYKEVYLIKGVPRLDMAIIKIEAKDLSVLPIGDSDGLVNGQYVIVLGNPWGFERSVSSGIVSAIRSKGDFKVIQMTAPVSPGSSGGPVINEYGEVIGITTLSALFMAQNLNFAIPINYLHKIISER